MTGNAADSRRTAMKTVKGHYDGNVVVLDEPAPVDHAVDVVVQFPQDKPNNATVPNRWWEGRFHWGLPRPEGDVSTIDSTDVIRRLRDEE
jgi:hypothetical protein